jgi:hypothetical protein
MEPIVDIDKQNDFRREIESVINKHSRENVSDTPDFILAEYLTDCLAAFDKGVRERERWYGRYVLGQPGTPSEQLVKRRVGDPVTTAENTPPPV